MGKVYALLVGINGYGGTDRADLRGCLNDVAAARAALERRAPGRLEVRTLLEGAATAAAVEEAIRSHLGQAGPGDTALFWFSGHGTQYAALTAQELAVEPTGRCQALVCADGPLPDKRLGPLLDGAAAGGAQVVAVLDCCFSGGATREKGARARYLPPSPHWRPAPAGRDASGPDTRPAHLLLAASRLGQVSYECVFPEAGVAPDGGGAGGPGVHGVFSRALVDALYRAGPAATGRELLAEAHARVRRRLEGQYPVLFPAEPGGLADRPLLGGAARTPSPHLLRHGPDGWEVDCGRAHGLTGGAGTEFTAPAGLVRAQEVAADRTLVEPDGWTPDPEAVYPVALSALALPPAAVVFSGRRAALPASPLLREVPEGSAEAERAAPLLRVEVRDARAHVLRRDGSPYVAPLPMAGAADAARLGDCLTRLARWYRIRDLDAGLSPLGGHVRVEILPWGDEGARPLVPDGNGEIVREYDGPREPWVSVRLRNTGHRVLWCVLLDLNDRFGAGSSLFPGQFIGPGGTGYALDGAPVQLSLPAARRTGPGASVRDWLKLIVTEDELNTVPFHLASWDPDAWTPEEAGRRGDLADGLLRLTAPPGSATGGRDVGPVHGGGPGQWATRTVALRTVFPG
ncbi:caspase family protein [Streptomyces sp. NBC_01565]|uniref:caspase family protein n=1 Tax=Streptomyces sp. NBC_01565 TaxID=2975881 RepID=UPI00224EB5E8|nr:caspase family protein [Streptomyces sp. NBC_01565]MCX4539669.1 caspase family protein [Streptomyces sp. NBC_01565]